MTSHLTDQEQAQLLALARETIRRALGRETLPTPALPTLAPALQEPGACFVTLTREGELRGCVGSIEASQPLALDVRDRAYAAAFEDPRFPPLGKEELEGIEIEISRLTRPERLEYRSPEELPRLLRPGIDGVILRQGFRRATFLPQVWEKLPQPEEFLGRLCQKMGLPAEAWRESPFEVETYQVEMFSEGASKS